MTPSIQEIMQEFTDKFVKNENGFDVVQAYDVQEYYDFLQSKLEEARKQAFLESIAVIEDEADEAQEKQYEIAYNLREIAKILKLKAD